MMKRILVPAMLTAVSLVAACGRPVLPPASGGAREFTVVTTFYPLYIMALNVAKDVPGVRVVNMTEPITGCLHDYQLTTADLKTLETVDALVVNGAGMESFLDRVLSRYPKLPQIVASRGVRLIDDNPHVWVGVEGARAEVANIAAGLAALDTAHASLYQANARAYDARLAALAAEMHAALDSAPRTPVVTFHEAFPYFAREFGLNVVAVVEREPGSEPTPSELGETIRLIRRSKGAVIFTEPQYSSRAAEAIARETGAKLHALDPAVTGPDDPDAYLAIMRRNLETLRRALR